MRVRGKNLKNGKKREENNIKKREIGLKNASFGVINSKNFRGGGFRLPAPLHNVPSHKLIRQKLHKKRGKRPSFWVINSLGLDVSDETSLYEEILDMMKQIDFMVFCLTIHDLTVFA